MEKMRPDKTNVDDLTAKIMQYEKKMCICFAIKTTL